MSGEFNKEKEFNFPSRHDYLKFYSSQLESGYGLDHKVAKNLVKSYGDRAFDLVRLLKEDPSLKERIHKDLSHIKAEIIYQIRHEMAMNPIDVLFRRTRIGFINRNALTESLPVVIDLFAKENKWSTSQAKENLNNYGKQIEKLDF